jgi:catechol 2,3-dioxygenase-like lactoylglutathione lyase family enzyme
MFMDLYFQKIFNVGITVPDIEEALKFYRDVLGLKSTVSLRNEKQDGKLLGFTPGEEIEVHAEHLGVKNAANGTEIGLLEFIKPKTIVDKGPYKQRNHVGINCIFFDVDNVDEIYEKLRERGDVEIICEPRKMPSPDGGWHKPMTIRDPYGILLGIVENHHPAGKKK